MDRFEVVQAEFKKHQISDPSHFKGDASRWSRSTGPTPPSTATSGRWPRGSSPATTRRRGSATSTPPATGCRPRPSGNTPAGPAPTRRYSFGDSTGQLGPYAWYCRQLRQDHAPRGPEEAQRLGPLRHARQRRRVVQRPLCPDYYAKSPAENPRGPAEGQERVLRGGAWNSTADACRSTYRASDPAIDDTCLANDALGFRCVRKAPAESLCGRGRCRSCRSIRDRRPGSCITTCTSSTRPRRDIRSRRSGSPRLSSISRPIIWTASWPL